MATKKKRRLTEAEVLELRGMMESAPQGRKPTIRQFAHYFGVNQPSIVKSLGGWDGIQRGQPSPVPKPKIVDVSGSPIKIEEYSSEIAGGGEIHG